MSVKELGEAGRFSVIRFCVKSASVARSRWKPVWLVALLVQFRLTEVAEAGVAPRPEGRSASWCALGEKVQVEDVLGRGQAAGAAGEADVGRCCRPRCREC